ncbi:MAG: hypothetical protein CVU55_06050 [Deltaproteobacteria bacterium HGW-Deltaproteobacteria-13]|jgi:hypothetical protein|nr:MAG: hypothetical protein CVU55_06050 [Deltaproteobacteria bacterium HGW-Deltaproteobacteria-13]
MYKILILAVIAVLVMMPFASFSKTVISDSDLKDLIAEPDTLQLNNIADNSLNLTSASFSGSDGFTSHAGACYAGSSDFNINGPMNTDIGTNSCYAGLSNFNTSSSMNIDIDTNGFRTMPDILQSASIIGGANDTSILSNAQVNTIAESIRIKVNAAESARIKALNDANVAASRPVYPSSGISGSVGFFTTIINLK